MKKDRLLVADICRGIAIILVVWWHFVIQVFQQYVNANDVGVVRFIYSFHMPLFMLISGYFFYRSNNTRSFGEIVKNRIKTLLIPLLLWGSVCVGIVYCYLKIMQEKFGFTLHDAITRMAWEYWFLWALIFYGVTMSLVRRIRCIWLRVLIYIFVPLIVFFLTPLKWILLTEYPFFLLGYLFAFAESKIRISNWIKVVCGIGSCYVFGIAYLKYTERMYISNQEIHEFLRATKSVLFNGMPLDSILYGLDRYLMLLVLGLTGSVTVIFLVWIICFLLKGTKILDCVGEIGQFSMHIYLLQRVFVEFIFGLTYGVLWAENCKTFILTHESFFSVFVLGATSLLFVVVCIVFAKKIKKGKVARLLFGR